MGSLSECTCRTGANACTNVCAWLSSECTEDCTVEKGKLLANLHSELKPAAGNLNGVINKHYQQDFHRRRKRLIQHGFVITDVCTYASAHVIMTSLDPSLVKSVMTGGEIAWQGSIVAAATIPSSPETTIIHFHPTTSIWSCNGRGYHCCQCEVIIQPIANDVMMSWKTDQVRSWKHYLQRITNHWGNGLRWSWLWNGL